MMSIEREISWDQSPKAQLAVASGAMLLFAAATFAGAPYIAAAPIALLLIVRAPALWCLLFMSLSYFRITEAYPFLNGLGLTLATGICCLIALSWHGLVTRTIKPFWSKELKLMLALFGVTVIGIVFAYDRSISFGVVSSGYWKIITISIAIAWLLRTPGEFRMTVWCVLISGTLISAVAIYNAVNGIGLVEGNRVTIGRELRSPIGDPNDLAFFLMFPFGLALSMLRYPAGRLLTAFASLTVVMTMISIIATRSRGGILGTMVVVTLIGMRFMKSRTLVLTLAVLTGMALFVVMGISSRISGGAAEIAERGIDQSSAHRIVAWRAAINMALANPLTGVGIENFRPAFHLYTPEWIGRSMVTHSVWFGILGEAGFVGFFCFSAMIYYAARSAQTSLAKLLASDHDNINRGLSLGCLTGLAAYCVAGSFLSQHYTWPVYILVALTAANARYTESLESRSP